MPSSWIKFNPGYSGTDIKSQLTNKQQLVSNSILPHLNQSPSKWNCSALALQGNGEILPKLYDPVIVAVVVVVVVLEHSITWSLNFWSSAKTSSLGLYNRSVIRHSCNTYNRISVIIRYKIPSGPMDIVRNRREHIMLIYIPARCHPHHRILHHPIH